MRVVVGITITVLVIGVIVVAGLLATGWFVASNVHVEATGRSGPESVRIETPVGSLRVQQKGKLDLRHFGVPLYPGSSPEDQSKQLASVELDFAGERKELTVLVAVFSTVDSLEKVGEYYTKELPGWSATHKRRSVTLSHKDGDYHRTVSIHAHDGKTLITLAYAGEPPAI